MLSIQWPSRPTESGSATGSNDRVVKLWDAVTNREMLTLKGHSDSIYSVVFSPDGKRLATGSGDHTVRLWDATPGQKMLTSQRASGFDQFGAAFSPRRKAAGDRER